jgi:hypothetical protein
MTVYDADGNVAFTVTAVAGQPTVTTVQYLKAGTYTVRYSSSASAPAQYNLFMLVLSDEVGTYATTTASPPPPGGSSPPPPPSGSSDPSAGGGSWYNPWYTYSGSSTSTPSGYGYTY